MSSPPFALSHFRIFALLGKKRVSPIGEMNEFQRLIEVALGKAFDDDNSRPHSEWSEGKTKLK